MSLTPRLKKRVDFLRVAACQRKVVKPTMIVQLGKRSHTDKKQQELPALRVGFTASRKVGNAVKRNRARRRLKVIVEMICPHFSFVDEDIVLIASPATVKASFPSLLRDFDQALTKLMPKLPPSKLSDLPLEQASS
jgi:ribonuclease P protein component